jgi:hypothetical protein
MMKVKVTEIGNPVRYLPEIEVHPNHWEPCMMTSMRPRLFDTRDEALSWGQSVVELIKSSAIPATEDRRI